MNKPKVVKVLQWLDAGIFPATILFSSGFTYKELTTLLKKKKANDWLLGISKDEEKLSDKNWWGITLRRRIEDKKSGKEITMFYIIIKDFDFSDKAYCTLAHEILHICQFFLPDCLNRDNEVEAEAYLHTYIMRNCLKALRGEN